MDNNKRVIKADELIARAREGGNEELAMKLLGEGSKYLSLNVICMKRNFKPRYQDRTYKPLTVGELIGHNKS